MKSHKILICTILFALNISYLFGQECNFYNIQNYKNEVFDTIYVVNFQSIGKCSLLTNIDELGYVPNSSMSFSIGNCNYYIPMLDSLFDIFSTLDLFYDYNVQIRIKVRYYKNEKYNGNSLAIITDIIEFKVPDKWIPFSRDR